MRVHRVSETLGEAICGCERYEASEGGKTMHYLVANPGFLAAYPDAAMPYAKHAARSLGIPYQPAHLEAVMSAARDG